jgi:hypothetical protein
MKNTIKLIGVIAIMAIVFLVSCRSSPSPSPTQTPAHTSRNQLFGGVIPDQNIDVNYTISDSSAFSFALAWVAQEMINNGDSPITVNDRANGIIAGQFAFVDSWGGMTSLRANFRILIKDGIANLRFTDIRYIDNTAEGARQSAIIYENWVEEWLTSFRRAFE